MGLCMHLSRGREAASRAVSEREVLFPRNKGTGALAFHLCATKTMPNASPEGGNHS